MLLHIRNLLAPKVHVFETVFQSRYADLPVLFVDSYNEVTEALLHATLSRFETAKFNWGKLTVTYWQDKIRQTANKWIQEQI